jgi:hypothetical protein
MSALTATLISLIGLVQSSQVSTGTVIARDYRNPVTIAGAYHCAHWSITIEGWTPTGQLRQRTVYVSSAQWYAVKEGGVFTP